MEPETAWLVSYMAVVVGLCAAGALLQCRQPRPTISELRGHKIALTSTGWVYVDTGQPTAHRARPCGECGLADTPEGHDGCLGTLPWVLNACCGHGQTSEAYIQTPAGRVDGAEAVRLQELLKQGRPGRKPSLSDAQLPARQGQHPRYERDSEAG